jgi:putative transposase
VIGPLKKSAGDWLRERIPRFRWQRGFAAFSVSPDRVRSVQRYVQRQEQHHARRPFKEELEELCSELGINIDDLGLL